MTKRVQGIISVRGLRLLALAGLISLSFLAYRDTAQFPAESRIWNWIAYAIAFILLLAIVIFAYALFGRNFQAIQQWIFRLPAFLRLGMAAILLVTPAIFLVYSEWGENFAGKYMRFVIFLLSGSLATLLLARPGKRWVGHFLLTLGVTAYLFYITGLLGSVQMTPFSLGWSEGNRFYDYSLSFARNLYQYRGDDLRVPYNSPGRYALWGALFLIPGLPIWAHRLWNALLWAGTPLLLSWLLFRPVRDDLTRRVAILWGALFINQGPVYPHLLVPMLLFTPFLRTRRQWLKLLAAALFSYYAGISRFTWAVLPGAWLVLYDLLEDLPRRSGTWPQKLWKPALLGAAGMLPGILGSWFSVITPEQAFVTSQPLLLYRLWPNATYGQGIVIGALLISLPVVVIIGWMVATKRWQIHPLAGTAVVVALAGFLVAGLAASTKIGGGSNLHNLDMYILTLVFLISLLLTREEPAWQAESGKLPCWLLAVIVMGVLLPGWVAYQSGSPVQRVPLAKVNNTLATIRQAVDEAKSRGEVLFVDQRQLLTFGYIRDVLLVPDYEKKYMMDQAMGENAAYFAGFEKDLKGHRFSLIVSDIQKISYQDQDRAFSEENNAYVRWVSKLLLKYYEPVYTQKDTGVMLLEPKP